MKSAVIFYHKNIQSIYKQRWIDRCVDSIRDQTYKEYDVIELDYSGRMNQIVNIPDKNKIFHSVELPNHIHAMNFLLDDLFSKDYDVVFNTNMDDYFHPSRFEKQINKIKEGFDLVSSDFCYIEERGNDDVVTLNMNICRHGDIAQNLNKKHNVIAHPCVAFSKTFWGGDIRYKDLLGWEDLELWTRAINSGKKFHIINEVLLFYRIHQKQVTKEHKFNS